MQEENTPESPTPISKVKTFKFVAFIFFLAVGFGALHAYHVATMFENSRHFSHLSPLEREMTFRTEMGMYYSYYKTIVESKTFSEGITRIMNDGLIEYPDIVNALKRFNIYPEVFIGYLFHVYTHFNKFYEIENKQCWNIRRSTNLNDIVISCEGIGEPIYFYLMFVWVLSGLTVSLIFIFSFYLCKNIDGAILAVMFYFYNHSEATRVQWSPPLRENFAFPFIILNAMTVTFFLRRMVVKPLECNILQIWTIGITGCVCLILWQFSQFILMMQLVILFIMQQLKFIIKHHFFLLLSGHLISICLAVIIMHGNNMLISSLYLSLTSSICINFMIWDDLLPRFQRINIGYHYLNVAKNILTIAIFTFFLKSKLSMMIGREDDSHIYDILKFKLFSIGNFHTMLYTCSSEFDFLPLSSIKNLSTTLLLPCAILSIGMVFYHWVRVWQTPQPAIKDTKEKKSKKPSEKSSESDSKENEEATSSPTIRNRRKLKNLLNKIENENHEQKEIMEDILTSLIKCPQIEPEVLFNILQLFIYFVMAVMIMRLKLFLTPYLCIIASIGTTSKYYQRFIDKNRSASITLIFFIIISAMSIKGIPNILSQRNIVGEFNNEPLEELLLWINNNTEKTAAFAGPMPVTSAILLSTRRPIVNHPHYEDANLRARTKIVYSMFGRQSPNDLYDKLNKLKITYLVVDSLWCFHKSNNGCTMLEIWDAEQPHLKKNPPICFQLFHEVSVPHFHRVFSNSQYVIVKLHEKSVNVKLKNYESYAM